MPLPVDPRELALVNIGANPDDGAGDRLRDAFEKINFNILNLYNLRAQIFYTEPTHPYHLNDLWLTNTKLYICTTGSTGIFQQSD
jgi:hypothetical protein